MSNGFEWGLASHHGEAGWRAGFRRKLAKRPCIKRFFVIDAMPFGFWAHPAFGGSGFPLQFLSPRKRWLAGFPLQSLARLPRETIAHVLLKARDKAVGSPLRVSPVRLSPTPYRERGIKPLAALCAHQRVLRPLRSSIPRATFGLCLRVRKGRLAYAIGSGVWFEARQRVLRQAFDKARAAPIARVTGRYPVIPFSYFTVFSHSD
jgi:hypothetical protein